LILGPYYWDNDPNKSVTPVFNYKIFSKVLMPVAHARVYCSVISVGIACYGFWSDYNVFKNSASGKLLESNMVNVVDPILTTSNIEGIRV
jgi:hypothetical protein